jgi:hypothetical protein
MKEVSTETHTVHMNRLALGKTSKQGQTKILRAAAPSSISYLDQGPNKIEGTYRWAGTDFDKSWAEAISHECISQGNLLRPAHKLIHFQVKILRSVSRSRVSMQAQKSITQKRVCMPLSRNVTWVFYCNGLQATSRHCHLSLYLRHTMPQNKNR